MTFLKKLGFKDPEKAIKKQMVPKELKIDPLKDIKKFTKIKNLLGKK
jgi:hypothetical protein